MIGAVFLSRSVYALAIFPVVAAAARSLLVESQSTLFSVLLPCLLAPFSPIPFIPVAAVI
jgi:hypothetical protein